MAPALSQSRETPQENTTMAQTGIIEGFQGSWGSGLGFLVIDGAAIPCDNGATVRALNAAFPGFITADHTVDNDVIEGQEVVWDYDELGLCLGWFCPADQYGE
jgi:hypothetical protein